MLLRAESITYLDLNGGYTNVHICKINLATQSCILYINYNSK